MTIRDASSNNRLQRSSSGPEGLPGDFFRQVFRTHSDSISVTRLSDGMFLDVSQGFERITEHTRAEVIGRTAVELGFYDEVPGGRAAVYERLLTEGSVRDLRITLRTRSGNVRHLRVSLDRIALDGEDCSLTLARDITEQVLAEEDAQRSEVLMRNIIDASPNSVFVKDRDGVYITVNRAMAARNGLSIEAMVGMRDAEVGASWFESEEEFEQHRQAERHVIDTKKPLLIPEEEFVFRDGHRAWFQTVKLPLAIQGRPDYLLGVAVDITERKRMEAALRESEERYRTLFEHAGIGIGYWSPDGRLISFNQAALTNLQGQLADFVGKSAVEIFDGDLGNTSLKRIQDVCHTRTKTVYEDNLTLNGREFWFHSTLTPIPDARDDIIGVLIVTDDVTELKRADTRALESRLFAENVIQTASIMIVGLDLEGRVTLFNPCGERITGYSQDELIGKNWFQTVIPPDQSAYMAERFEKLGKGRLSKLYENPILTKAGEERIIAWSNNELIVEGEIIGSISFGIDITERRQNEEKLLDLNRQLAAEQKALINKNIALKEILEHMEEEKRDYRHQICDSIGEMLAPIVDELEKNNGQLSQRKTAMVRDGLDAILRKDVDDFASNMQKLSPRELDVCGLIRRGRTSKEMATELGISTQTVHKHRQLIRKKLQINNKAVNLAAYLRSRT